jgi:hypothetical protein
LPPSSFSLLVCAATAVAASSLAAFALPARALAAPPAANSPTAQFARGNIAFQRAEYGRAIELIRPLLYPELKLNSEGEMVQAHRMLGVAHLFMHQNDLAADEFRKLLQLRPDFRMDALIDPPMVVDFFNGVLGEQEAEIAELDIKRREAEARAKKRRADGAACPPPAILERRTIRNSRAVSFLPFGAGQFQNGHSRKGWSFFAAETALGAISLGALATNFALYGVRPTLKCEASGDRGNAMGSEGCSPGYKPGPDRSRSELLLKVQLISGTLFFATAIWGVTDAILNFEPEVVVTTPSPNAGSPARPTSSLEHDDQGDGDSDPAGDRRTFRRFSGQTVGSTLRVGPAFFPDGLGGTLAFRF